MLEALSLGEAARPDMLMREHAYIGMRYGRHLRLENTPAEDTEPIP